jgi:glycosyltransferase involved in cell wall biosynthesis
VNILNISTEYNLGGSGRSAYRVHKGLQQRGHISRMLVAPKLTGIPDAQPIWGTLPWRGLDWFAKRVSEWLSLQYLFLPSSWKLLWHPWFREADIVQLYNVHGGYFSYPVLSAISRHKPVVWRLSDMWPMTGHCCYSFDCERWQTGCGACPLLADDPALKSDRTALLWRVKRWVYAHSRITLVAPSKWIADVAKRSPLLRHCTVHLIPNGLDVTVFRPTPKKAAREILGMSGEGPVILFSSLESGAHRKGGAYMRAAIEQLRAMTNKPFQLLIVGNGATKWELLPGVPMTAFEAINDDHMLATIYSSADVFVHPALADNLPNGVLESMACGTPVVAFAVGGLPDAVRPMETGYLARLQDATDLAKGIHLIISDTELQRRMAERCRVVAETEYSMDLQSRRFEDLYASLLL